MAELEYTQSLGLRCDKPGCDATRLWPFGAARWSKENEARLREAAEVGWSLWVSRGQRHYCPRHGPKHPTNMRRIW